MNGVEKTSTVPLTPCLPKASCWVRVVPPPHWVGGFNVSEFFGEANIPVLDKLGLLTWPIVTRITAPSGGQDTYRLGLDWQPIDLVRLRAGYNRAVRAPNVGRAVLRLNNLGLWAGVDPCGGA